MMRLLPNWKHGLLAVAGVAIGLAAFVPGCDAANRKLGPRSDWSSDNHDNHDSRSTGQPRAALVAFVREDQVAEMVDTMQRLEQAFNGRHNYDWILFCESKLSDEVKSIAANLTSGRVVHHTMSPDSFNSISARQTEGQHGLGKAAGEHGLTAKYPNGMNSAPFTTDTPLGDYDWFWKVEPGSQFPEHIEFDVFQAMRDNQMVYGFSKTIHNGKVKNPQPIGQSQLGINQRGPYPAAPSHRLLPETDDDADSDIVETKQPEQASVELPSSPVSLAENQDTAFENTVDLPHPHDTSSATGSDISNLSPEQVMKKLFDICVPGSNFEIGSLEFIRDLDFFEQGDINRKIGGLQMPNLDGQGPTLRLDASPEEKDRVYGPHRGPAKETAWKKPSPEQRDVLAFPQATPIQAKNRLAALGLGDAQAIGDEVMRFFVRLGDPNEKLSKMHEKWERIREDFARRGTIPGLISGNTVIDDRNFHMLGYEPPNRAEYNLVAVGLI